MKMWAIVCHLGQGTFITQPSELPQPRFVSTAFQNDTSFLRPRRQRSFMDNDENSARPFVAKIPHSPAQCSYRRQERVTLSLA